MQMLRSAALAALFALGGGVGAAQETPSATRLTTDHYFDLERISAQKVLKFDQKGNDQALALIKATDKDKDWKVVVTGKVEGQTIAVHPIALE